MIKYVIKAKTNARISMIKVCDKIDVLPFG